MDSYSQQWSAAARVAFCATLLALVVIMFGAYTRLKEAGLGCPDWPGCYGQLQVPKTVTQLAKAQAAFPHQPLESAKAWAEMTHRYLAGTLVLLILALTAMLYRRRHALDASFLPPSLLLVALVIFQAALGMWTVTLLLYPPVVMGHLLAGMTILGTLWWLTLMLLNWRPHSAAGLPYPKLRMAAFIALLIVAVQIALGGWTSANYAGPACPDFPFCQGQLLPDMGWQKAFNGWLPVGANFQGGLLDNAARMVIHRVHRMGALITFLYVGTLAVALILANEVPLAKPRIDKPAAADGLARSAEIDQVANEDLMTELMPKSLPALALRQLTARPLRLLGILLASLLGLQIILGILFITLHFPLAIGVLHNGGAALLWLAVISLNAFLYRCHGEARHC